MYSSQTSVRCKFDILSSMYREQSDVVCNSKRVCVGCTQSNEYSRLDGSVMARDSNVFLHLIYAVRRRRPEQYLGSDRDNVAKASFERPPRMTSYESAALWPPLLEVAPRSGTSTKFRRSEVPLEWPKPGLWQVHNHEHGGPSCNHIHGPR